MPHNPDSLLRERFLLPANWSPEGVTCMLVPIPDDPQYLAMAIGLLDMLKWSTMYARDPTKTGAATVARTWRDALATRPILFRTCEGDDMTTIRLRVKPGVPYISQFSPDSGVTWIDFLIQPHWDTALQAITLSDNPNAGADLSAQIFRYLQSIVITINNDIAGNVPQAETVANIVDSLNQYGAGATLTPALNNLYANIKANASEAADWETDCPFTDPFAFLKGAIEGAGANLFLQLSQALGGLGSQTASQIGGTLFDVATILGAGAIRDIAQSTNPNASGVDFGVNCFTGFVDTGNNYRLYGPWVAHIVSPPGDQETLQLAHFALPANEEIVAVHGLIEGFNAVLGFHASVFGATNIPFGFFGLFSQQYAFEVNNFPPPTPCIGATRTNGEPATLYASAGLGAPTAVNQGGLQSFAGPHSNGAFTFGWGDTANNVSEVKMTLHIITKLV